MSRILHAWINEQHIGTLHEANGVWAFEYSAKWLAHPGRYPLCPGLPLREGLLRDGGTTRPAQWYFDNLLPEEGQRTLLAGSASLDAHDAFALLAYYGAESAGSVTLLPDTASEADRAIHPLPDDELSRRIRQMPHIPLTHEAKKRMSLAGAQHKLAVILTSGDGLYEPEGGTPSTHILKPDHPDLSYAHSVINEWFVMTLAARVKLNVPTVSRRYVPQPVYLIQRFDRQQDGEQGGIKPATAGAMIDRLRANVMKEALGLYDETEQAHREVGSQRPELRPTLGGELRCLRAITKVIIADMCRQVGAAA